ncbi:MAG: inositol monophosphatase family protein, partial [Pseudomonadota bacterium]
MSIEELVQLEELQQQLETLADTHLLSRFGRIAAGRKADGSVITEADLSMQAAVGDWLRRRYPRIPLLAEEQSAQEHQRLLEHADSGVWCLDPLDGTANFAAGMPLFSVSLALISRGRVMAGLVYDPVRREAFAALAGQGAWLNGKPLDVAGAAPGALDACVAMVDFKRLSETLATRLAVDPPYRSQRSIGSVALDWAWLAAGRFQLYLHGGQKLWDYAAGYLVAAEAGAG